MWRYSFADKLLHGALVTGISFFCLTVLPMPARAEPSSSAPDPIDAWNLFSPRDDVRLGDELDAWLKEHALPAEATSPDDHHLQTYIQRVGDRLTAGLRSPFTAFHFELLAIEEPGVFAFPGGRVYCSAGMLQLLENESMLAASLAHEIAHVQLRHTTQAVSRAGRLSVPAALAAASSGNLSLLEALRGISLEPLPGSPWMTYREADETQAIGLAAELLSRAGYDPAASLAVMQYLHAGEPPPAVRFAAAHPLPDVLTTAVSPAPLAHAKREIKPSRAFRNLQKRSARATPERSDLGAVYAWSPPAPAQPAPRPRELFIARSYVFSYPSDWVPGKSGVDEKVQVMPKGEQIALSDGSTAVRVGVFAGTLAWDPARDDAAELLNQQIERIRPGLVPAAVPAGLDADSDKMSSRFLRGPASDPGRREMAWVVTRGLSERLFYLLMIAPEADFKAYQPEFERIFQSIDFLGHPSNGQADVRGRAAINADREPLREKGNDTL